MIFGMVTDWGHGAGILTGTGCGAGANENDGVAGARVGLGSGSGGGHAWVGNVKGGGWTQSPESSPPLEPSTPPKLPAEPSIPLKEPLEPSNPFSPRPPKIFPTSAPSPPSSDFAIIC